MTKLGRKLTAKAALRRLREVSPDLAALVDDGFALNEAIAVYRMRQHEKLAEGHRKAEAYLEPWERELKRILTSEQWREHEARKARAKEFDVLPRDEQVDMARWVLAVDPDLALQVRDGLISLAEVYHELKEAKARTTA
jgi:hypothetical protein